MNVANIVAMIREDIAPEMRDQFYEEENFYNRIMRGRGKMTGARGVRIPSRVVQNASFGGVGENGVVPEPGDEDWVEMKVFPTDLMSGYKISGRARANLKRDTAMVKLSDIIERASKSCRSKIDFALAGDGTGEIARVLTRDSGTQFTCAQSVAAGNVFGATNIIPNAQLQFVKTADDTYRSATATIVSTAEPGTGVVTADQVPAGAAPGDPVVFYGSWKKYPHGLQYLINNGSGMIQGQSRGQYPGLRSTKVDAQNAALTVTLMNYTRKLLRFRSTEADMTTLVSNFGMKQGYEEQARLITRFNDPASKTMQLDFKDVAHGHNGKGWEEYSCIPYHKLYGVNFDDLNKYELEKFGIWDGDGQTLRYQIDATTGRRKDTLEGHVVIRFDLGTPRPLSHFLIDNLSFDGHATAPLAFAA